MPAPSPPPSAPRRAPGSAGLGPGPAARPPRSALARASDAELALQLELLQARSALLRESLGLQLRALQAGPAGWRWAGALARGLRQRPWLPALAASWLVWRRPRRVLRWAWRAWGWWRLGRRAWHAWALWNGRRP